MERPFEVQHIIGFIESGGVTQYSQSQMVAMTEYVEQLETELARIDDVLSHLPIDVDELLDED